MDYLFTYENGKMSQINEPWGCTTNAPLLFIGVTNQGQILYRFGKLADSIFIQKAETLLLKKILDISIYLSELKSNRFCQEVCFYYPTKINSSTTNCRLLTTKDSSLLSLTFKDEVEELETAQPFIGYFLNGQIVSICRSVRKGKNGEEAGIETLPSHRRRGFAQSVLNCWISEVQKKNLTPFYSANIDNLASLNLAQKTGFIMYAKTIEIY